MKHFATLALLALLVYATPGIATANPALIGTWEWTHTLWEDGVTLITPADVGYTTQYEFAADGTCRCYRNEILRDEGTWETHIVVYHYVEIPALTIDGVYFDFTCCYYVSATGLEMIQGHDPGGWPAPPTEYYEPRPVAAEPMTWGEVKAIFR